MSPLLHLDINNGGRLKTKRDDFTFSFVNFPDSSIAIF